ncbi:MAG: hypothetical protein ACTSQP_08095 [Promethearchaeota archaeon]
MSYFECPNCKAFNPINAKKCIRCSISFEEEDDISEVIDKRIVYIIASNADEAKLAIGESFEKYKKRIDYTAPYGRDKNGLAHLFPMDKKHKDEVAYREEMVPKSDYYGLEIFKRAERPKSGKKGIIGKFENSGLFWDLNPTLYIGFVLFLPFIIGIPILYLFLFKDIRIFYTSLKETIVLGLPFFLLVYLFHIIIDYAHDKLESLLKPYGREHNTIKLLFIDELEFLKFSKKFFNKVYSMKWMILGFIGGFSYLSYFLITYFGDLNAVRASLNVDLPDWAFIVVVIFVTLYNMGIAAILAFVSALFPGIFYGLFIIGNLGKDRSKLSITKYKDMINTIIDKITEAQLKKKPLSDLYGRLDISGRTYYEFQRANRKIGEFLFNVASYFIFLSVFYGILIWIANLFNLIPENLKLNLQAFTIATTIFGVLSLGIFLLPQLKIHKFLKDFKYTLIDNYSSLVSRLEYLYFESFIHPEILEKVDRNWKTRKDILKDIQLIKNLIKEFKEYGTWSYDFPEIMKFILVAGSTTIPTILSFLEISI